MIHLLLNSDFRKISGKWNLTLIQPNKVNAGLDISGAIRDSSRVKLYQELGLETLQQRRLYGKLCFFFYIKFWNHGLEIASIRLFLIPLDPIELGRVIKFQLSEPSMTFSKIHFPLDSYWVEQLRSGNTNIWKH